MSRADAIATVLRALTDSARAINSFRTTTTEQARGNTLRALSSDVMALRQQLARLEQSFVAVSEFASRTVEQFGQLEQRIENLYRERLAGRPGVGT